MNEKIKQIVQSSIETKEKILKNNTILETVDKLTSVLTQALKNGNRIYFCGNGGSAADAQHLAAEFSGRFYKDREALPAEALHCNTSYLTAVANDYSYDVVYARLIKGIGQKGDVLVGLSTSGNSGNRNEGYRRENEKIEQLKPSRKNSLANRSLKVVIPPPRSGWAGPIIMIFFGRGTSLFFRLLN